MCVSGIDVSVPGQESEQSCTVCVSGIDVSVPSQESE